MTARLAKLRNSGHHDHASGATIKQAVGCTKCRNTGFAGRTTIYELITMCDAVRNVIVSGGGEKAIEDAAASGGMVTMLQNGMEKVFAGETTLEEVLRVTSSTDATL